MVKLRVAGWINVEIYSMLYSSVRPVGKESLSMTMSNFLGALMLVFAKIPDTNPELKTYM